MSVVVKVKVCADCFTLTTGQVDTSNVASQLVPETSYGFGLWGDYEFAPAQCSSWDFANDTTCGICHRSLTKDRRRSTGEAMAHERRVSSVADRRTPHSRGCRVLLASLRAA